jgi:hypothetical protein
MTDQTTQTPAPKLGILDYLKMLFNGRAAVEQALAQEKLAVDAYHTAGIRSLAFWTVALTSLGAVAAQVGGLLPPPWGAVALALSATGYAISRGLGKQSDPTATAKPTLATSEGILNILGIVAQVVMAWQGVVPANVAAMLAQVHALAIGASQALAATGSGSDAAIEAAQATPEPKDPDAQQGAATGLASK